MARIVIYDSGVGGLTIYQQLLRRLGSATGSHSLVFVSDNAAYPYGIKIEAELQARVSVVAPAILKTYSPDVLVVACNTASTLALSNLREQCDCEVVGVVPAIKPAAQLTSSNTIGLLATPGTIERHYTQKLIDDFAGHCEVVKVGSNDLVEMAEAKLKGQIINTALLAQTLKPFVESHDLDVLVLACTHFPILAEEINSVFKLNKRSITLLDSGDAIARRILSLSDSIALEENPGPPIASFTRVLNKNELLNGYLKELGFSELHHLKT